MTEIKLISKSDNFASGDCDWDIANGHVQKVSDTDAQIQDVIKVTCSRADVSSGYGCGIREFRGVKNQTVMRLAIITRIMKSVALLEKLYNKKYDMQVIDCRFEQGQLYIYVKMELGELAIAI